MIQGKRSFFETFCKLSGQCVIRNLTLLMLEVNIMFHEKKTLFKSYAHVLFRITDILNHHSAAGVEVP